MIVISSIGAHSVVGKPGLDNPSILAYASTKGALGTLVRTRAARHPRKCTRACGDRHGHVEFYEDRGGS
jgi:hypothetical protein